jgi:hypothetical protein
VEAGDSAYSFLRTLKTSPVPASSLIKSGSANNDSPTMGTRDVQGVADIQNTNFEAYRTDRKFSGLVINDRDTDLTTVDPGEALAGAIINLYQDDDGSGTAYTGVDSLVGVATTDAGGAFSFTGLREGRYTAVWVKDSPTADVAVVRSWSQTNVLSSKITATTLMAANVANVGPNLPAWNYANSTVSNLATANFTYIYSNTVVRGTTKTAGGVAIPGMSVTLQRCWTSTANTVAPNTLTNVSGPQPETASTFCTLFFSGQQNAVTDATGAFSFPNLPEGVYKVLPVPGTVVGYTTYTPTGGAAGQAGLYLTVGSGDIETLDFVIS